ncbi:MAG TPA: Gfo/Idh/MocA family oxidoreductase [Acidobacteriota bacterium]|nr:Gfo/Idh/MocA family oxidoreductase [Acidobacteriota bacterium]
MSLRKVRWGILSTARIGIQKVIPALQAGTRTEVAAIASRDGKAARKAAADLGIPVAYGSYEELLDDPQVEAVYNPLPNHLHAPWSVRAAEAGKHVLCEKPLALTAREAAELAERVRPTGVLVQEAFMIRFHPQWIQSMEWIHSGRLGRLWSIQCHFSYDNPDPSNIRNVRQFGGGGLLDIGCYAVFASRWAFRSEPKRVFAISEDDPKFRVDRLASAVLEFDSGHAVFTVGTQMFRAQGIQFVGSNGSLQIEVPFNAPPDRPCRILLDEDASADRSPEVVEFPICDQFTLQGDRFSRAALGEVEPILSLEDSIANMAVLDALAASAESGKPESPGRFR